MRKTVLTAVTIMLPFLGLAACDDATGPDGDASLSVQLTDAPSANVNRAWVKVEQLTLQGSEGGVNLLDQPTGFIQLTDLVDRTETLVQDEPIPPNTYGQLRFIIAGAAVETDEGEVYSYNGAASEIEGITRDGELQCPSCGQTGIKVNMPEGGLQLETEAKILVLDFDVSESFGQQAGMSGMWVMNPLITSSTVEASGTIAGTVSTGSNVSLPTCAGTSGSVADFVPRALEAGTENVVKSGSVSSDGSYQIQFLEPADYDMGYSDTTTVSQDSAFVFDASPSVMTATVQSGAETTVDYTINSADCVLR